MLARYAAWGLVRTAARHPAQQSCSSMPCLEWSNQVGVGLDCPGRQGQRFVVRGLTQEMKCRHPAQEIVVGVEALRDHQLLSALRNPAGTLGRKERLDLGLV